METKIQRFLEIVRGSESHKASNSRLLSRQEYNQLLDRLVELSESDDIKKTKDDYRIENIYSVLQFENTKSDTSSIRAQAFTNLKRQAEKMVENTNKRLKPALIGETVLIPIPDVDRGRGDHKNLKGIILSDEDGFYRIGTEFGTLDSLYTRNQFSICKEKFLDPDSVPNTEISLRSAAKKSSSGTGQGHFFCKCTTKCKDGRCKCKRAERLCGSKCHNSGSCCNKG